MRADRLLSILLLLQVNGRITARELAKRLEVSERTIYRDVDALGAAGVPVYAERGIGGGIALMEHYRTNLTGLNEGEIQALFLSGPSRLLADLGLRQAADGALVKLLAALPTANRRNAEYARQRILIDTAGWRSAEETVPSLPALQEAVWQERKIEMCYRRSDGETVIRVVDPLGLVAKGSMWYLVAAVNGEMRTYRVSRVMDVRQTGEPCERPDGFDLAVHWEESSSSFVANLPHYDVRARVSPKVLERLPNAGHYPRVDRCDPPGDDGWCEVTIRFDSEEDACETVLGFGPGIEVLEPPELRAKVFAMAAGLVAFYAGRMASLPVPTADLQPASESMPAN